MEKIEYRYRFWYRYRPKFMVSDWYRIEPKKAGIARHYRKLGGRSSLGKLRNNLIYAYYGDSRGRKVFGQLRTPNSW